MYSFYKILIICLLLVACQSKEANKQDSQFFELAKTYNKNLKLFGFSGEVYLDVKGRNIFFPYVNSNTVNLWPVASITKPFTAVSILKLMEMNKFQLEDTLSMFFENVPLDKVNITIEELLTHTSGLVRDVKPEKPELWLESILASELFAEKGNFNYSNAGYQLLSMIIEHVSGVSYEDFIREFIFKPAGMTNSWFESDTVKWKLIPDMQNEFFTYKVFNTKYDYTYKQGNTGILSNSKELILFIQGLINNSILKKQTTDKLFSFYKEMDHPYQDAYGYGFYFKFDSGDTLISHGGDIFGYHSELTWSKNTDAVIAVCSNQELYGFGVQKRVITSDLISLLKGDSIKLAVEQYAVPGKMSEETFYLDSLNQIKLYKKEGSHYAGIKGQQTLNLWSNLNSTQEDFIEKRNQQTQEILNQLVKKDKEALMNILSESDFSFYADYWMEEIEANEQEYGPVMDFRMFGSDSYPWEKKYIRTYCQLQFKDGSTVNWDFVWKENGLFETLIDEEYECPINYPLVINEKKELVAYNMITKEMIQFDHVEHGLLFKDNLKEYLYKTSR